MKLLWQFIWLIIGILCLLLAGFFYSVGDSRYTAYMGIFAAVCILSFVYVCFFGEKDERTA